MTVAELIDLAFIDLGVIQPGEGISPDMLANAFKVLNLVLGGWSVERTMNFLLQHQNFTPNAGTENYTLGVGGSFNTSARPIRLTSWESSSGNFSNSGVVMSMDEFRVKTLNPTAKRSILAEMVGADQGVPLINVEVFPVPDTAPGTLRLDYWTPIVPFANTGATVTLADEYTNALHFNLAVALAPQYARTSGITPELAANAQNSKAVIVAKNADILGLNQQQAA